MTSILHPLTCGFPKLITFKTLLTKQLLQQGSDENVVQLNQLKDRVLDKQYNALNSFIDAFIFNVSFEIHIVYIYNIIYDKI